MLENLRPEHWVYAAFTKTKNIPSWIIFFPPNNVQRIGYHLSSEAVVYQGNTFLCIYTHGYIHMHIPTVRKVFWNKR